MHPALAGGGRADQAGAVAQQRSQVADGLGRDPGLGQQVGPEQLRQGAGIDLVVLQPGRGDRLAAAGGVPGGKLPRIGTSLAGSLGTLRLRWGTPAASTTATWERLRYTSIPTYILIRASFPELDWSPKPRLSG